MKTYEQIDAMIEERRNDTEFMARLARRHETDRELYAYLAKR